MSNPTRLNLPTLMGLVVIGGLANLASANAAHASEYYLCKMDFVAKCKAKGGDHDGCFAAAESVCGHLQGVQQPNQSLTTAGDGVPARKLRRRAH